MTVSNVLNRRSTVSERNRLRVINAVEELGYVPNETARQLRGGRSRTIAVFVLDAVNPFYAEFVRGIEETCVEAGYLTTVLNAYEDRDREQFLFDGLQSYRPLGLITVSVSDWQRLAQRVEAVRTDGTALVAIADSDALPHGCTIAGDAHAGGRLAGHHLAELGHERIGYLGRVTDHGMFGQRLAGLRDGLADSGGDPDAIVCIDPEVHTIDRGGSTFARLREDHPEVTAVLCGNDLLALGALRSAVHQGLSVPGDVALVGWDDTPYCAGAAVPLTAVAQPTADMGVRAAQLLLEEIEGTAHEHVHESFAPFLVERASTLGPGHVSSGA